MSRVAVVTGVGRPEGIGFERCRQLAADGDIVVLTARHAAAAEDLAGRLGADVRPAQLDVTNSASVAALTAELEQDFGCVDVLINNAVCPGFTATFPGGEAMGARPVAAGAASILWAARLPNDGPRGGFFRDGQPLPW